MKNQKGITLLMLVVTIVVILLLVGVSLNIAFQNNGVIFKANDAKIYTNISAIQEGVTSRIVSEKETDDDFAEQVSKGYMKRIINSSDEEIFWITKEGLKNLATGYEKDVSDNGVLAKISDGTITQNGEEIVINDLSDLYTTNIYVMDKDLKVAFIADKVYGDVTFYAKSVDRNDTWWKEKNEITQKDDIEDLDYSDHELFLYDDPDRPDVIIGFKDGIKNYNEDKLIIPIERPLYDEFGNIVEVIRITEIAEGSFSKEKNPHLQINSDVTVANGIKIGDSAFKDQALIKSITVDGQKVGESAFEGCSGVLHIEVDGAEVIEKNAFKDAINTSTFNLTIGDTVRVIEDGAFEASGAVNEIVFSKNLERIGKRAFANLNSNSGFSEIDLSECKNLVLIDEQAFEGNQKVETIKLPSIADRKGKVLTLASKAFNLYLKSNTGSVTFTVELDDSIEYKADTFSHNVTVIGGKKN